MFRSFITLLFLWLLLASPAFGRGSRCVETSKGPAIDWASDLKLEWSDFQSTRKVTRGFSIAASTCGFGYDGIVQGNSVMINVYVRFYCEESWKDPDFDMSDVLEHEQLHFDICELYGRKLYEGITELRSKDRLNEKNLQRLYDDLVEDYDRMQDRYDKETNHSTVGSAQKQWNERVRHELDLLSAYAGYKEY